MPFVDYSDRQKSENHTEKCLLTYIVTSSKSGILPKLRLCYDDSNTVGDDTIL